MALKQSAIARMLRPFTLHAQEVMAQAYAGVERLPAVMAQVQRALEHAGLAETFRLLPDVDQESAARGARSYPETSAQHHALWAAIMAAMISKKPTEAQRYLNAAEVSAALALAARIAEPTQAGVKTVQVMQPQAFRDIKSEWGSALSGT